MQTFTRIIHRSNDLWKLPVDNKAYQSDGVGAVTDGSVDGVGGVSSITIRYMRTAAIAKIAPATILTVEVIGLSVAKKGFEA